jgi:hypothetical protein
VALLAAIIAAAANTYIFFIFLYWKS